MDCQVAILLDDMIDTGNTLSLAAKTLHERGAKSIHALISHGLLDFPCSFRNFLSETWVCRASVRNQHVFD